MLIAQKKKKENIAEYILYLFQIEDIVRSFKFNLDDLMDVFEISLELGHKYLPLNQLASHSHRQAYYLRTGRQLGE